MNAEFGNYYYASLCLRLHEQLIAEQESLVFTA